MTRLAKPEAHQIAARLRSNEVAHDPYDDEDQHAPSGCHPFHEIRRSARHAPPNMIPKDHSTDRVLQQKPWSNYRPGWGSGRMPGPRGRPAAGTLGPWPR